MRSTAIATVQYRFRQRFPYSADRAFRWCLDFRPEDLRLEGEDGTRSVTVLSDDAILLKDTFHARGAPVVTKSKLVRIREGDRSWTSTHVSGPNRHSQFWYRIVADSASSSHLDFIGLHLERLTKPMSPAQRRALANRLAREDAHAWESLTKAMRHDLG